MKTLIEILDMTPEGRAKLLKSTTTSAVNAKVTIAKILVAAAEKGDYGKGEMNTYAQRVTGIELRRELQGTYEAVNVLEGIRAGTVPLTEAQFEKCPDFGRVTISGLLSKHAAFVPEACEIILEGTDVTKRLKALKERIKEGETPNLKILPDPKESKGKKGTGDGEGSGIQTAGKADADTFTIPRDTVVLNHPGILERIIAEVKGAGTVEDCDAFLSMFSKLKSFAESRRETLEAESADSKKLVAAA